MLESPSYVQRAPGCFQVQLTCVNLLVFKECIQESCLCAQGALLCLFLAAGALPPGDGGSSSIPDQPAECLCHHLHPVQELATCRRLTRAGRALDEEEREQGSVRGSQGGCLPDPLVCSITHRKSVISLHTFITHPRL